MTESVEKHDEAFNKTDGRNYYFRLLWAENTAVTANL